MLRTRELKFIRLYAPVGPFALLLELLPVAAVDEVKPV